MKSQATDADVCTGMMTKEGHGLYSAFRNMSVPSHTAETYCSTTLQQCNPKARPYTFTFPSPKPKASRPPPSGKKPIEVVHFSDTHIDLSYEEGSSWQCNKPMCCRSYTPADAPGNNTSPCGHWGNIKCDPPLRLHESMLQAIADKNPEFSIYTGDVAAHDYWLITKNETLQSFNATYGPMEKNLGIVYSALGNHDTAPAFQFPSNNLNVDSKASTQWAYQALAKDWYALTGVPSVKAAGEHGSYSAIHPKSNGKLRIISYNSILYYKNNFYAFTDPIQYDPDNQLHWLINELQEAEDSNQRVWLISHIPVGSPDHFPDYSHYLNQIIDRYEATIAALFFGHTHRDEFQLTYATSNFSRQSWDTATAMGYVAPSLTPSGGPPSFRVYQIDPVTYGVLDYTQYIANITNLSPHKEPEWKPYYSAKASYGSQLSPPVTEPSAEMTPAFWHNVTKAMDKNQTMFHDFWSRRSRGFNVTACAGSCASNEICALRGGDVQTSCYKPPSDEFNMFSKRDGGVLSLSLEDVYTEPECNHAEAASLFGKMAAQAKLNRMQNLARGGV